MDQNLNIPDMSYLKILNHTMEPIRKQAEFIDTAISPYLEMTNSISNMVNEMLEPYNKISELIPKFNMIYEPFNSLFEDINSDDVCNVTLDLENHIQDLVVKDSLSDKDKENIFLASEFIFDKRKEFSNIIDTDKKYDEIIDKLDFLSSKLIESEQNISSKERDRSTESRDSEEKEELIDIDRNTSFFNEFSTNETFQSELISYIYQNIFNFVFLVTTEKLEPLAFLIILSGLIKIFTEKY